MADNKRQHYVPKMYLKYFIDKNQKIDIYQRENGELIKKECDYSSQCQKKYFYSKNIEFEKILGKMENDVKNIFDNIIKNKTLPSIESGKYEILLHYILVQSQRTLYAADILNQQTDKLAKVMLKIDNQFRKIGISNEKIEKAKINYSEPALLNIREATLNLPLLTDLRAKILLNETKSRYITSDNPVVFYNLYFLDDFRSNIGLTTSGLLVIFPINPNILILLYDPHVYKLKDIKENDNIKINSKNDIIMLNRLQILNSYKNYYTSDSSYKQMEKYYKGIKKYIINDRAPVKLVDIKTVDGEIYKNVIQYSKFCIRYRIKFSFLKMIKKSVEDRIRNPILRTIHKEFVDKFEKKEIELHEWGAFYEKRYDEIIANINI